MIGIKADFNGYTQGSGLRDKLTSAGYTAGNINGNVFTYMFGPQFKRHSGKLQPFVEGLFGARTATPMPTSITRSMGARRPAATTTPSPWSSAADWTSL